MESDTTDSLAVIRANYKTPIFTELLRIQNYKSKQEKSLQWIRHLQCLRRIDLDKLSLRERRRRGNSSASGQKVVLLGRQIINPLNDSDRDYVVVSYPWKTPSTEADTPGGYHIRSMDKQSSVPNGVRDVVLDRVIKYMEYRRIELFWIDQECVDQADSKEKEAAMQAMDLVYSLSKFPVGLLSVHIESEEHINILIKLLNGQLVMDKEDPKLQPRLFPGRARKALRLLQQLTSDSWWTRAWTFQEDYRSSTRMFLLIPHSPALEAQKQVARDILGSLPSVLCVNSANFREKATEFCLAYQKRKIKPWEDDICSKILQAAGKYRVLLPGPEYKSMSPSIFADIAKREITKKSDLLAIAANCCEYSTRLITTDLSNIKCSLSLCILTLYLLNGEIIWNNRAMSMDTLRGNIFDFLKKQSLHFNPPVIYKELTFIKSCRLPGVRLLKEGIKTSGQLWKLGKVVETRRFSRKLPWERPSVNGLGLPQRRRLRQLVNELLSGKHGRRYATLARNIKQFLYEDAGLKNDANFIKENKDLMAAVLVRAIDDGKKLCLARPIKISPKGQAKRTYSPYCGIFVADSNDEKWQSYIFTASEYSGYTKKYVSLEVNWDGSTSSGLPLIVTKRWVNGLCFFDRCPQVDVVFPWPDLLEG